MFAEEYLLTDQFYKIDPELFEAPTHGDAAFPISPFSEDFFYHCYDRINYPKHLWDVLATLGDWIFPGRIPPWFELKDVVKRLAYLVERGHIKIWKLKNQRMRMIVPVAVEVTGGGGSSSGSSSSSSKKSGGAKKAAAYNKKVEKEKAQKKSADELPEPLQKESDEEEVNKTKLSPQKVDWNNSGPSGLQVKDPRDFSVGMRMYESLLAKGLEPDLALTISRELLESSVNEPSIVKLKPGDKLYKVVPKNGGPPGENSPYFMTKEMLDKLPVEVSDAASTLGLPQAPEEFDLYSITAKEEVEVFQSEIALFSVNGGEYLRSGGGTQTLVTDRSQFAAARLIGD